MRYLTPIRQRNHTQEVDGDGKDFSFEGEIDGGLSFKRKLFAIIVGFLSVVSLPYRRAISRSDQSTTPGLSTMNQNIIHQPLISSKTLQQRSTVVPGISPDNPGIPISRRSRKSETFVASRRCSRPGPGIQSTRHATASDKISYLIQSIFLIILEVMPRASLCIFEGYTSSGTFLCSHATHIPNHRTVALLCFIQDHHSSISNLIQKQPSTQKPFTNVQVQEDPTPSATATATPLPPKPTPPHPPDPAVLRRLSHPPPYQLSPLPTACRTTTSLPPPVPSPPYPSLQAGPSTQ